MSNYRNSLGLFLGVALILSGATSRQGFALHDMDEQQPPPGGKSSAPLSPRRRDDPKPIAETVKKLSELFWISEEVVKDRFSPNLGLGLSEHPATQTNYGKVFGELFGTLNEKQVAKVIEVALAEIKKNPPGDDDVLFRHLLAAARMSVKLPEPDAIGPDTSCTPTDEIKQDPKKSECEWLVKFRAEFGKEFKLAEDRNVEFNARIKKLKDPTIPAAEKATVYAELLKSVDKETIIGFLEGQRTTEIAEAERKTQRDDVVQHMTAALAFKNKSVSNEDKHGDKPYTGEHFIDVSGGPAGSYRLIAGADLSAPVGAELIKWIGEKADPRTIKVSPRTSAYAAVKDNSFRSTAAKAATPATPPPPVDPSRAVAEVGVKNMVAAGGMNCVKCHHPGNKKGDLDLTDPALLTDKAKLTSIRTRVVTHGLATPKPDKVMPPASHDKQPTPEQLAEIEKWLATLTK